MGRSSSCSSGQAFFFKGRGASSSTLATALCPGREAGHGNAETRRGKRSLEDMPEKCHAERDEESNLDRERERSPQPAETQPVSVSSVWWDAH